MARDRLLAQNRDGVKRDALGRLRAHLERCGKPEEVSRYEARLDAPEELEQ